MKKISLLSRKYPGLYALVDDTDFDWLSEWKWRYAPTGTSGYATGRINNREVLMHRVVNKTPNHLWTDHVDGNGLNNQRDNLRSCTPSQNAANASGHSASGYRGVTYSARPKGWIAYIGKDMKTITLGRFDSKDDAARAYNVAALEHHGEFARLNIIQATEQKVKHCPNMEHYAMRAEGKICSPTRCLIDSAQGSGTRSAEYAFAVPVTRNLSCST